MSFDVFAHDGSVVFEGTWTAITAAKSFNANLLSIPKSATHWVRYTGGATAALTPGEELHAETTTGVTAILVAQAVEVGTAGSSDTGILFIKNLSAAMVAEVLHGGTTNGHVTIAQTPIPLVYSSPHPKALLITAESYAVTCTISGTIPTVAAGTNHGITIAAGGSRIFRGINNIRNFQAINTVNNSGAIMHYELYY
jgi:hypothetical protein